MSTINVGGHLSLGRKPAETVRQAAQDGFRSMQIFASSPAAWRPPVVDEWRAREFVHARLAYEVEPLFIHAIYLINLASTDALLVRRSKASLIAALQAGGDLGAAGVVTHIGSHGGIGFDRVADQVAACLLEILAPTPESVQLILENSAGAGAIVGSRMAELGDLIRRAGTHPRLAVALDTAHLVAAGWDFAVDGTVDRLLAEVETEIGLERLVLIHANDSAQPCGSRKDRHANIGEGHIGLEGFRRLLREPALRRLPWILETPHLERRVDDLAKLRALAVEPLPMEASHAS